MSTNELVWRGRTHDRARGGVYILERQRERGEITLAVQTEKNIFVFVSSYIRICDKNRSDVCGSLLR